MGMYETHDFFFANENRQTSWNGLSLNIFSQKHSKLKVNTEFFYGQCFLSVMESVSCQLCHDSSVWLCRLSSHERERLQVRLPHVLIPWYSLHLLFHNWEGTAVFHVIILRDSGMAFVLHFLFASFQYYHVSPLKWVKRGTEKWSGALFNSR